MKEQILNSIVQFSNGVKVINCTGHECNFVDGDQVVVVQPSGLLINAKPIEKQVSPIFVTTEYVGNEEGRSIIAAIREVAPDVVIIGSVIAAQAYPGEVAAMIPVPGFERVASNQKRMRTDKFTIFLK